MVVELITNQVVMEIQIKDFLEDLVQFLIGVPQVVVALVELAQMEYKLLQ